MKEIISGLIAKGNAVIKAEDGDYIKDGLLYCGKCHTPKQICVAMPWGEAKPYVLCECMQKEEERRESERKAYQLMEEIKHNKSVCFSLHEQETMEKKNFLNAEPSKYIDIAKRYADNFPVMLENGKGLTLLGAPGAGKSYIAACICNALLDKGYKCLFTNFARIRNDLCGLWDDKQEYIDDFSRYSLLVFDDLGAESSTEYMAEVVHSVIDSRLRSGLPMIVTTNLTKDELFDDEDLTKSRIYSRLFEATIPIAVKSEDHRKNKIAEECKKYRGILGY